MTYMKSYSQLNTMGIQSRQYFFNIGHTRVPTRHRNSKDCSLFNSMRNSHHVDKSSETELVHYKVMKLRYSNQDCHVIYSTVKSLIFVDPNFRGSAKKYIFVDS